MTTATRRRDWFMILRHLMAEGISMGAVARKCGRDVCTVRNWGEGGEPKESDARTLLALYAKHCPAKYREHQRPFRITAEIERLTGRGETEMLPFIGDDDE